MLSISSRDSGACGGWGSATRPASFAMLILISSLGAMAPRESGSEPANDATGEECGALCKEPAAIIAEITKPRYTAHTPGTRCDHALADAEVT